MTCRGELLWANGLVVLHCKSHGYSHLANGLLPQKAYEHDFWEHCKAGELRRLRQQESWWRKVHYAWLDHARQWLGELTPPWLLDVGAGVGLFVEAASERGFLAIGMEPSAAAIAAAEKSIKLIHGFYQDASLEDWPWRYDLISAHWLIEHLPDPEHFLAWCGEHLEKNGILMLAIPNEWSALQKAANQRTRRPHWWLHATHFAYWSRKDFEWLLEKQGWRIVSRMGTFPMELFILLGLDYVDRPHLGQMLHRIVETVELALPLPILRAWYSWLGWAGVGRDTIFFCARI